jgi:hypothetical protein
LIVLIPWIKKKKKYLCCFNIKWNVYLFISFSLIHYFHKIAPQLTKELLNDFSIFLTYSKSKTTFAHVSPTIPNNRGEQSKKKLIIINKNKK